MTGSARLEIIDGLQRLNSIFEFIENEYPVAGAYFDLETLAETELRRDAGELAQRTLILDLIAVSKLEDLQPGLHLAGVIPGQSVSVNAVQPHGVDAIELTYKTADGELGQRVLGRDAEEKRAAAHPEARPLDAILASARLRR